MTLLLLWCSTPSKEIYKDGRVEEERSKLKKRKEGRKEDDCKVEKWINLFAAASTSAALPLLPPVLFSRVT